MREILKILLYFAAVVVIAAIFSPPLYWLGEAVAARFHLAFLDVDFHAYFDRAILIAAIALLYPLAKALRIESRASLGLHPNPFWKRDLIVGLGLACGSAIALTGCAWYLQAWRVRHWEQLSQVLIALQAAAVVPLIEEPLFRGVLQGAVQRTASRRTAFVFVAVLFAIVHFLTKPQHPIPPESIGWFSGFQIIPLMFWKFTTPQTLLGSFTTLLLVSLILGYARVATASLWMPIGLHAGWILGQKLGKIGWRDLDKRPASSALWFGDTVLDGLCPVLILLLTSVLVFWILRGRQRATPAIPGPSRKAE